MLGRLQDFFLVLLERFSGFSGASDVVSYDFRVQSSSASKFGADGAGGDEGRRGQSVFLNKKSCIAPHIEVSTTDIGC